ncbi:MAG: PQQ-binding-like beta-propeller repeat protein [Planctomycetaceae bacterium]|nr:PQQ-binding-like beta-propeller repeat protein [Planctomycetaceae bacterium]MCB9953133.1 PQQ-binding-like beta-propeller repeat protein [Planctomycetaceae bacterium]
MARLFLLTILVSGTVYADDWNQFRGTTGSGVIESPLPDSWAMDSGIQWSVELPGRANSSPVVTEQRIDVTTQTDDGGLWVLSFDRAKGKKIRETRVGTGQLKAKGARELWAHRHNAATPTPIATEDSIWAFFGNGLLVRVDPATGDVIWKKDLEKEYGAYDITFGMGSSPRLVGNHLLVACMTKGASYLLALDAKTGQQLWKSDRKYNVADDHPDSYSSPIIWNRGDSVEVLLSGAGHLDAYGVKDGKRLWSHPGLSIDSPYGRVIASPVPAGDLVIGTSPNPSGGGRGRIAAFSAEGEKWSYERSLPDSSTPVVVGDLLFMVSDNGVASCLETTTGKLVWQNRLGGGPYHASVIAGDGKVYFQGIDGVCTIMKAGREKEVVARNTLPGTFYATPAAAPGTLYLRAYERLYAIGN